MKLTVPMKLTVQMRLTSILLCCCTEMEDLLQPLGVAMALRPQSKSLPGGFPFERIFWPFISLDVRLARNQSLYFIESSLGLPSQLHCCVHFFVVFDTFLQRHFCFLHGQGKEKTSMRITPAPDSPPCPLFTLPSTSPLPTHHPPHPFTSNPPTSKDRKTKA